MGGVKRKASNQQLQNSRTKRLKTLMDMHEENGPEQSTSNASQFSYLVEKFKGVSRKVHNFQNATELPNRVDILKFAEARSGELAGIMNDMRRKQPKQTAQQLPHHMRRRAASHNVKRVPRRLREKAAREIYKAKKGKRPSRKHRRRPSNLLLVYERRARSNTWLETHIWFAKRFKLEKLWGYYLPIYHRDKSERASCKAAKHYAVLQDLSYMCCLELCGPLSTLLAKLSDLTDKSTGLTFTAKSLEGGKREGHTVLYHPGQFPFQAIGPVSFIWQPTDPSSNASTIHKVWIWCHPSIHQELLALLRSLFKMEENKTVAQDGKTSTNHVLDPKFRNRLKKTISYTGEESVRLTSLKDNLVRHRLIGPRSQSIVMDVLKSADLSSISDKMWWTKYHSSELVRSVCKSQEEFWKVMEDARSHDEFPSRIVLGLTVKDPRLDLLPKREVLQDKPADDNGCETALLGPIPESLATSAIWEDDIRNIVTATKQPDSVLNKLRSELVLGSELKLDDQESRIPILLIQQPNIDGYGGGWDLIAPLGWSMPFWIAFIYRGARVFGLRDLHALSKDMGKCLPPINFPDTNAGETWQEENRLKMMQKHLRYPPAKRPSFQKMGIPNPFFMPWGQLVDESMAESNIVEGPRNYFVLRSRKILQKLQDVCVVFYKLSKQKFRQNLKDEAAAAQGISEVKKLIDQSNCKSSLVCLKFESLLRGNVRPNSGVYLLDKTDYVALQTDREFKDPREPIHKIKRQAKLPKIKQKAKLSTEEIEEIQRKKLQKPVIKSLVSHCSRKLIGYVECGGYSLVRGCGYGVGHCSLLPLIDVFENCMKYHLSPTVLVRSQNSLQYRAVVFNINI